MSSFRPSSSSTSISILPLLNKLTSFSAVSLLSGDYDQNMNKMKRLCKENHDITREIARYLVIDATNHRKLLVRYNCLLVMDVLFKRSKIFRDYVCGKYLENQQISSQSSCIRQLLVSSGVVIKQVTDHVTILSGAEGGNQFFTIVCKKISNWDESFGKYYPELHAASRYVKESIRFDTESTLWLDQIMNILNSSTKQEIFKKFQETVENMKRNLKEVKRNINLLDSCYKLVTQHHNQQQQQQQQQSTSDKTLFISSDPNDFNSLPRMNIQSNRSTSGMISHLSGLDKLLSTLSSTNRDLAFYETNHSRKRAFDEFFDENTFEDNYDDIHWVYGDDDNDDDSDDDDSSNNNNRNIKESFQKQNKFINEIITSSSTSVSVEKSSHECTSHSTNNQIVTTNRNMDNFDNEVMMRNIDNLKRHINNIIKPLVDEWYQTLSETSHLFGDTLTQITTGDEISRYRKEYENIGKVSSILLSEIVTIRSRIQILLEEDRL